MMRYEKRRLCGMDSCYAVSNVGIGGKEKIIFAPDDVGPCYAFDTEDFKREVVCEGPGGTMSMVPLPGRDGEILAIQRFFPGFRASDSEVVHPHRAGGAWRARSLIKLPYVHRFDILRRGGVSYIILCTLCSEKRGVDDWSSPGKIYAAELPEDLSRPIELSVIAEGMTRNHGYCRIEGDGYSAALTSCDQGLFEVSPPASRGGRWELRKLIDAPISDIALCDIDGDGIDEIAAISPFHGDELSVYRKTDNGYARIYRHDGSIDFGHVVWGGLIRGKPVFLGGCRGAKRELFALKWRPDGRGGCIESETIDEGFGPSNVVVVHGPITDLIAVANHEAGECAVYAVRDESSAE